MHEVDDLNDADDVNGLKAERVQIWEQVVAATRSFCRRIFDLFEWIEIKARAAKDVFASRDHVKR